jgi:RimJ/RimL family protein N-acetyltransferase
MGSDWIMPHPIWPLFDLRVRTGRVEVRSPNDGDLIGLAHAAAEGIHDASTMPFLHPWTDAARPDLERGVLQWAWRQRAEWTPRHWHFLGAVFVDGVPVGVQGMEARDFRQLRSVRTGSWLTRRCQGQGIGKEMRVAILHLAFAGLGAVEAHSGGWSDNDVSLRLSRSLGYQDNGRRTALRRGSADTEVMLRLDRSTWESSARPEVTVEGLEDCLELFDADDLAARASPTPGP